MATSRIQPFEASPIDSLPVTASLVRTTFQSQKTKPIAYRIAQLRKLYWSIVDNESLLLEALKRDLNKCEFEAITCEISWVKSDIVLFSKNLHKWAKDESAEYMPLLNKFLSPKTRKEPMGAVLVIGCWNFPLMLSLGPFLGAIAAGCTAVLKPSEVSPHTAMVLKKIVEEALDSSAYAVINGGVEETTALLNEKWAKITYTGNATVGRIVMMKAAETLTPVTLELGGLNPAIVTRNANIRSAARRLLWGKTLNSGQVCVGHNYAIVDREVFALFVEETKKALRQFYPDGAQASPDYGRIVNKRHFHRIKKMLEESKGKILAGGKLDEEDLFIEPTVVQVDSIHDSLVKDETFAPIVPIITVSGIDEAIRIANSVDDTPLAIYPFGSKAEVQKFLQEIQSGGASINDSFYHGSIPALEFGGVGHSGTGSWHGKASYYNFTHKRSITTTPSWLESFLNLRIPPYESKVPVVRKVLDKAPDFDREGRTVWGPVSWIFLILGLGGDSAKVSLIRWVSVILLAFTAKKIGDRLLDGVFGYLK